MSSRRDCLKMSTLYLNNMASLSIYDRQLFTLPSSVAYKPVLDEQNLNLTVLQESPLCAPVNTR